MPLKNRLEEDLKAAMLAKDSVKVAALKLLKSAILYKEVELGKRAEGLSEEQIIEVFSKEAKKRLEASRLYEQNKDQKRAEQEMYEHDLIAKYLPKQLSDEELDAMVKQVISQIEEPSVQQMGKIIGMVKQRAGAMVEGGRLASVVKRQLLELK